jgi:putative transposase
MRFDVAVHAYVFMTNHVHLLVSEAPGGSLSQAVQMLGRRYVSYFNYLHERTGTLWEGRFHSSLVETERYLFVCHQYIEENPVRAGLVFNPGDFAWSSHSCLAHGRKDDLVTPHPLYLALGCANAERLSRYRGLFRVRLDQETISCIRGRLQAGLALGSEESARMSRLVWAFGYARAGWDARPDRRIPKSRH